MRSEVIITIDASIVAKAFKSGMELGFMIAKDGEFEELDKELNINKIDEAKDDAKGI